jgi:hypothetical protein
LDFSLKSGTTLRFIQTGEQEFTPVTCTGSTLRITLEKGGGATETVSAPMNQLTWSNCTAPTATLQLGKLEIHSIKGTSNGLVTWSGFSLTYNSFVIGSCVWGPEGATTFGTLAEGRPPTLEVNTVLSRLSGSTSACPTSTTLKGEFTLTEPSNTTLSVSTS